MSSMRKKMRLKNNGVVEVQLSRWVSKEVYEALKLKAARENLDEKSALEMAIKEYCCVELEEIYG